MHAPSSGHVPVMVAEVLDALGVQPGCRYIDATLGDAGHAREILGAAQPRGRLLGIDADQEAIERARELFRPYDAVVAQGNFRDLDMIARRHAFSPAQGVLFDLGLSSRQLDREEAAARTEADEPETPPGSSRGFSFRITAPLDMRFDPGVGQTAADIVNTLPEAELARVLWELGGERHSRGLARAIVARRPLSTTRDLVQAVQAGTPPRARHGRRHFATRTFQAVRMAVNDELPALRAGLEQAAGLLGDHGRLATISYHSLEDGTVKRFFREAERSGSLRVLTRTPLRPSPGEVRANPRSRSGRLRVAERLAA